jgi:hypothetical protein
VMQRGPEPAPWGVQRAVKGVNREVPGCDSETRFRDYYSENFGALGQTKKTVYIDN